MGAGRHPTGSRGQAKGRGAGRRGFTLFAVVVLLAMMTAAVALSLDEAVASIQASSGVRASEMIKGGLEAGVSAAVARVQREDVASLVAGANAQWDIFDGPTIDPPGPQQFVESFAYPADGPYAGQFMVRVGLRPGQRARAPAGEDVRKAYGQVLEVQVGVEARGVGVPPAEERVTVGLLVPRLAAHSH